MRLFFLIQNGSLFYAKEWSKSPLFLDQDSYLCNLV